MRFLNPTVEQEWRQEQCLLRRRQDSTTAAVIGLLTAAVLVKPIFPRPLQSSHLVPVVIFFVIQVTSTVFGSYSARQQPLFWKRYRPEIILLLQALVVFAGYFCLVRVLNVLVQLPTRGEVDFWCIIVLAVLMARVCLRYITPVNHVRVLSCTTFIYAVLLGANRCRDAEHLDLLTDSYRKLTMSLVNNVSKLLPITCARTSMPVVDNMTETGACVAIHSLCYGIFGVLLPVAVIYAEEEVSRGRFEADNGLGCGFRHDHTMSAILHLCLLPFQAAVMLHAVLFAVQWGPINSFLSLF